MVLKEYYKKNEKLWVDLEGGKLLFLTNVKPQCTLTSKNF